MSTPPAELSFDEILKFMIAHNGKVTNHELVKHFKVFLMNPDMKDTARNTFKKLVNTLAIIKTQNNEKWLILKKKYMPNNNVKDSNEITEPKNEALNTPMTCEENIVEAIEDKPEQPLYKPPPPLQLNQDFNILSTIINAPPMTSPKPLEYMHDSIESLDTPDDIPPKVHPRRKSSDKMIITKRPSVPNIPPRMSIPNDNTESTEIKQVLTSSKSECVLADSEQKISVKERKQMFNRMASESDVLKSNKQNFNSSSVDEEDRASLDQKENDPLDPKQKQWILCAARGEYHMLAKMCKENAKLVKTKDPFTTAMHWACKRGDENLVKLLAGIHRQIVNERSGYTPLHIAMQFRHENVYRLLVEVYDADPNVRDWSGKKPRQYLVYMDTSLSPGSYRKSESLNLRRTVTAPSVINNGPHINVQPNTSYVHSLSKKEGFLRIGSLNVRVKKTTEAFSNFLGVGATRNSAYVPKSARGDLDRRSEDGDQLKSWGSADNIQKASKLMPAPNNNKVRRRGASGRRGVTSHSRSTPSTPDQPRAQMGVSEEGDSDSDSAAGFHSAWRQHRASHS